MSESKKILVGIPMHKSEVHSQVIHSAIMGGSDDHEVVIYPMGLSLLAKCFNLLWIKAYNEGYDYVLIHHSDLGVIGNLSGIEDETWLDILIRRQQELEAAAICPVINIKSDTGLTSTALEREAGNPYSMRRLTLRELERCPTDFIEREDLCEVMGIDPNKAGCMMINTGCLLMDLRNFPWAEMEWPGFNIEDQIAWNTSGRPESYTVPEDWNMSRWFHYHGQNKFPYYATKELVVVHMGQKAFFNNAYDTGEATDADNPQLSIEEYRKS